MSTQPTYKSILDLDLAGAKSGNELIEVVQDGISKKMPLSQVAPAPTPTANLEAAGAKDGSELIEVTQDGVAKRMPLADAIKPTTTVADLPVADTRTGNELVKLLQGGKEVKMAVSDLIATKPITELPGADAKDGSEVIKVVQDGVEKKIPLADAITPTTTVADLAAAATKDGTELVRVRQAGVDKKMSLADVMAFDKYDLKVAASANGALAMDKQQVFTIDNTAATAKTLTFNGAPAGRAATYVVVIAGKAGAITWPANNVLAWNADTPPDLGATRTVVVLLWDGATFTGMQGPTR